MGGNGLLGQGADQQVRLEDDLFLRLDKLGHTAQQGNTLADGFVHGGLIISRQGNERNSVFHNASGEWKRWCVGQYSTLWPGMQKERGAYPSLENGKNVDRMKCP